MPSDGIFRKPTSVIIFGNDRPLLNWVANAHASINDPRFNWTDDRSTGQTPAPTDPMSRNKIPADRMFVRRPVELGRNDRTPSVAVSTIVRSDEPAENVQRLLDFLRLPTPTQHVLSAPRQDRPLVAVLADSHRVLALYPTVENVSSTVRSILATDATLIMTFADAPPDGRFVFETIVHIDGSLRDGWRKATMTVERGSSDGAIPTGLVVRLEEFDPIANVLAREIA